MNSKITITNDTIMRRIISFGMIAVLFSAATIPALAQARVSGVRKNNPRNEKLSRSERERERERKLAAQKNTPRKILFNAKGEQIAEKIVGADGIQKTTLELMNEQSRLADRKTTRQLLWEKGIAPEFEGPDRSRLPQNPNAPAIAQFPALPLDKKTRSIQPNLAPAAPQTVALDFNAASLADTGAFPPDTMGAVGPSQFIAFVNGRVRSFTKAGVADGVINADADVFFASVMTPVGGSVVLNFTSDPNIRYDRLTGRWILTIIDVPCTNATCTTTAGNRILFAVSDAASSSAITPATVWTFFQFQNDPSNFCDYPSLGVDASALYIGCNMFTGAGSFNGTDGFVVPKSSILGAGPLVSWKFANLATSTGAGPFAPRGVDNPDPNNTGPSALGYFIGVDALTFSTLMVRRVTNPGNTAASPTITANISLTVPTTTSPNRVTHLGNTGGANGGLDSLDDRLYAAVMRNGRLWTAHNFRVNSSGVASTGTNNRNAIRWYELQNLSTTPSLVQSGTVFDNAATTAAARQYWIPSITVTGQGHAALGASTAGTAFSINAFTVGRLATDPSGTMQGFPGAVAGYTNTSAAYNPPADPGGASGRRWGDYSFTSVDPLDDMTIWTIQEYCDATNSYGVRVAKLNAPPPAAIANGPTAGLYEVPTGQTSVNVTITGTSTGGSGWFDPGANLAAPALPFNHITASVSGSNVTVNSVTYNSPTSITLNLNTVGASVSNPAFAPESVRNLTITNPDGQSVVRNGIISISVPTAANVSLSGRVADAAGQGLSRVRVSLTAADGTIRYATTNSFGYYRFDDVPSGAIYTLSVSGSRYQFAQPTRVIEVNDTLADLDFTAANN
ncbi:MAG: carboxypeptidase regulatory-like domain-containing protein [Acidobacteria bacterium]|nr:carboxypeptidase regulatory-like domain-containing protein [Acidobacteriota bacterium]